MRILYLTEESIDVDGTLVRGGAIHVEKVVSALRERGHDVTLLDWDSVDDGPSRASVHPRTRFVDGPLRTYRKSVRLAAEMDADVIVSKTRKTYLPGLVASRRVGIPHVVHVGTTLDPPEGSTTLERIDSRSFDYRLRVPHDGYLVVCEHIRDQLRARGVPAERIHNVENAVDTAVFDPDAPGALPPSLSGQFDTDGFVVGFVGGLYDYKGVHDLVDAVRETTADVFVVFAGDGPERPALERRLGDANGSLVGPVPYESVPALYAELDAFVLPSRTEGLPRVVLEAQAMGTPVVATRVGGVPEVVVDGETGLLCPPSCPVQLSEAIDRLAADGTLRATLSKEGRRQVVDRFQWSSLYDSYEEALQSITSGD